MKRGWLKKLLGTVGIAGLIYLALLIPDPTAPVPTEIAEKPFIWDADLYWQQLESGFAEARSMGCPSLTSPITTAFAELDSLLRPLESTPLQPDAPVFAELEDRFFRMGVLLAACPEQLPEYTGLFDRMRTLVKDQSSHWDMNSDIARDRLYRLLYGGRMATEEVIMQARRGAVGELTPGTPEPSATPSADILGVTVHSGDILVSRGGAPTSALIARGNDYPGNFSHVAFVHIDDRTGKVSIIESHIECGVAVADIEKYLNDTKLRVMVLRLRADLPALAVDPMLPHKAAQYALGRAESEHIPYDFAMAAGEGSKLFCSEVVSDAYDRLGISLWAGVSHISSPGVIAWLSAFGVRNFTTEEPSDLEYDPQLRVVAEWRDYETLYKDRLDNAVVDVMLEGADAGHRLDYDWYLLPMARLMKAYSVVLNRFGRVGPIPEGMTATAALQNKWFSAKHRKITERLRQAAEQFERANGYPPPYWELVGLAREAVNKAVL